MWIDSELPTTRQESAAFRHPPSQAAFGAARVPAHGELVWFTSHFGDNALGEVLQQTAHHLAFDRGPGAGTDINKSMSAIECQGGLVTFEHGKSDPRSLLFASPLKNRIGQ